MPLRTAKKPAPAFEILFEGTGIYPEKIPLRLLSNALSAVQRLAAGQEVSDKKDEEDRSLGLLQVQRGSAIYRCFAVQPKVAVSHLRRAGQVLSHPSRAAKAAHVLKPIHELSSVANRLDCSIILKMPNRGETLATVEAGSFDAISETILVSGDTEITGRVERAGGATEMRAALRVPFQDRLLYCRVKSKDTVRELGKHLYQEVVARGRADWIRDSWQVYSFTIYDIHRPQSGTILEAFEAIREAGGEDWDRIIDPISFLEEASKPS